VPLTVLPFQKTLFSYAYNKKLALGSIVTIPLSGRTVQGVVLDIAPHPQATAPDWLKSILEVEDRAPLTEEQLALAEAVSHITFTPLGKVLRHFVPKQAKPKSTPTDKKALRPSKKIPPEIEDAIQLLKKESHI